MTDQRVHSWLDQLQAIQEEYQRQAPRWGSLEITGHLRWVVDQLPLSSRLEVVDVAAGTGLFGRAVAPSVSRVTAVDITPEMLEQGRRRAELDGVSNMVWREGEAENLPFADESFDLAITRYAVHHFVDPVAVLSEMGRVCRASGMVVVVDMVCHEDPEVAARHNALETALDPTHTRILSPSQLAQAAAAAGLTLQRYLSREVPMSFDVWQGHVPADSEARRIVRRALEGELAGGARTGMRPFRHDDELWFTHIWGVLMAGKTRRESP